MVGGSRGVSADNIAGRQRGKKRAACLHTTSITEGRVGDKGGSNKKKRRKKRKRKEGYKILIRQRFAEVFFCMVGFFFSLCFCQFPSLLAPSRAPPQRMGQTIFIGPN